MSCARASPAAASTAAPTPAAAPLLKKSRLFKSAWSFGLRPFSPSLRFLVMAMPPSNSCHHGSISFLIVLRGSVRSMGEQPIASLPYDPGAPAHAADPTRIGCRAGTRDPGSAWRQSNPNTGELARAVTERLEQAQTDVGKFSRSGPPPEFLAYSQAVTVGDRPMVGQRTLTPSIEVRILVPQPPRYRFDLITRTAEHAILSCITAHRIVCVRHFFSQVESGHHGASTARGLCRDGRFGFGRRAWFSDHQKSKAIIAELGAKLSFSAH